MRSSSSSGSPMAAKKSGRSQYCHSSRFPAAQDDKWIRVRLLDALWNVRGGGNADGPMGSSKLAGRLMRTSFRLATLRHFLRIPKSCLNLPARAPEGRKVRGRALGEATRERKGGRTTLRITRSVGGELVRRELDLGIGWRSGRGSSLERLRRRRRRYGECGTGRHDARAANAKKANAGSVSR